MAERSEALSEKSLLGTDFVKGGKVICDTVLGGRSCSFGLFPSACSGANQPLAGPAFLSDKGPYSRTVQTNGNRLACSPSPHPKQTLAQRGGVTHTSFMKRQHQNSPSCDRAISLAAPLSPSKERHGLQFDSAENLILILCSCGLEYHETMAGQSRTCCIR